MMWYVDFNPIIFTVGPLQLRWYSIPYIIGFSLCLWWLTYLSKKKILNLKKNTIDDLVLWIMVSVIIGARIFYFAFYNRASLIADPFELFRVWHGGMSFHGGLFGLIVGLYLVSQKKKIQLWEIADAVAPPALFALALGRIGNLINGEIIGTPFNGPWCAVFVNYDSVCRHPYPVYASLSHFLLFCILAFLTYKNRDRLKKFFGTKINSGVFLVGYGSLRILTDVFVEYSDFGYNAPLGIKVGQWLSIVMIMGGLYLLKNGVSNKDKKNTKKGI